MGRDLRIAGGPGLLQLPVTVGITDFLILLGPWGPCP